MSGNEPNSRGEAGEGGVPDPAVQKVLERLGVPGFDYHAIGGDEAAREARQNWPLVDLVACQLEARVRHPAPLPHHHPAEAAPAAPRPRRHTPVATVIEARATARREATPTQPLMSTRVRIDETPPRATAAGGRQVSRPRIIVARRVQAEIPPAAQTPSAEPRTPPALAEAAPQPSLPGHAPLTDPRPRGRPNSRRGH